MSERDETAKSILKDGFETLDGGDERYVQAMARLWLLLPEIRDTVQQYWDVDHADPNGDELEKFLARLTDEALAENT